VLTLFQKLADMDIKIVIASNPLWPLEVQQMRLCWAGLVGGRFDLITHVENMHSCKPNPQFYQEIIDTIKIPADACVMVGNDPVNDMSAGLLGITTYLTTDSDHSDYSTLAVSEQIRPESNPPVAPDHQGSLSGVLSIPGLEAL